MRKKIILILPVFILIIALFSCADNAAVHMVDASKADGTETSTADLTRDFGEMTKAIKEIRALFAFITIALILYSAALLAWAFIILHRRKDRDKIINSKLLPDAGTGAPNTPDIPVLLPAAVSEEHTTNNEGAPEFEMISEESTPQNATLQDTEKDIIPDSIDEGAIMNTTETKIGKFTSDALRFVTGADIGLINIGGMRSLNKPGEITPDDVSAAPLFGNQIVVQGLSGAQIKAVLEHSASMLPEYDGRFIQTSGITAELDAENPAGERVVSVKLDDGSPLCDDTEYIVALNEYIAEGGDGYDMLATVQKLCEGKTVEQAFMDYKTEIDAKCMV